MIGVPKPAKREPKARKPLKRTALKRSTKPIAKRNERRIARKAKAYGKLIRSDFNLWLRYAAWNRSNGYCECEQCVAHRKAYGLAWWAKEDAERAQAKPAVWFTKGGTLPYKRFRSTAGQLHHLPRGYSLTERESPEAINYVRWMHTACHQRIEAEHGTRRRFLKGRS